MADPNSGPVRSSSERHGPDLGLETERFGPLAATPTASRGRFRRLRAIALTLVMAFAGTFWAIWWSMRPPASEAAVAAALNDAIDSGDPNRLKRLLRRGYNPRARDAVNRTPLHRAAAFGDVAAISTLAGAGAAPSEPDRYLLTPLALAILGGHEDAVRALLRAGASADGPKQDAIAPLRVAVGGPGSMVSAPRDDFGARTWKPGLDDSNRARLISALLESGADPNRPLGEGGEPAVHLAARLGSPVLPALLRGGGRTDLRDREGLTPLIVAIRADRVDCVRELLKAGADPNAPAGDGVTAMHDAASQGSVAIVRALLEAKARPDPFHTDMGTPLARAVSPTDQRLVSTPQRVGSLERRLEVVRLLLAAGASPDGGWKIGAIRHPHLKEIPGLIRPGPHPRNYGAWDLPPLFKALQPNAGQPDATPFIAPLLEAGARVGHAQRASDWVTHLTPLHVTGEVRMIDELLRRGADIEARNSAGETPLPIACEVGWLGAVEALLDRKANPRAVSRRGMTALDYLTLRGPPPTEPRYESWKRISKRLIEAGVSPNPVPLPDGARSQWQEQRPQWFDFGSRPLHRVAGFNVFREDAIKHLVALGADPKAREPLFGRTPLFHAGSVATVEWLVKAGCPIDVRDSNGRTALFYGRAPIIKALLAAGAKVDERDDEGMTPWLHRHTLVADGVEEREAIALSKKALEAAGADTNARDRHGRGAEDITRLPRDRYPAYLWRDTPPHLMVKPLDPPPDSKPAP
jgi:ankyrin repeat protein